MSCNDELATNYELIGTSAGVAAVVLTIIIIYFVKIRHQSPPIFLIIALLLINTLLVLLFEAIGYIQHLEEALCTVSLIGMTAFTIAANFWVVIIMRLLYQERLAPGKQLDLIKSVYKNLFLTYMPSAGVSIFLLVIISLSESASQNYCWRTVVSRELLDCLIYFTCFVLPNLLGLTIISIYLYLYLRLPGPAHSCFLAYPLLMMAFNVYSLVVKLYLFFQTMESAGSLQYPNVLLPLVFALYLLYGYWRTNSVKNTRLSEQFTIQGDSNAGSFLQNQ